MALVNINEGLKEEYSMNKTFSAEYDFSCVRQIARADRFACADVCACDRTRQTKRPGNASEVQYKGILIILHLHSLSVDEIQSYV